MTNLIQGEWRRTWGEEEDHSSKKMQLYLQRTWTWRVLLHFSVETVFSEVYSKPHWTLHKCVCLCNCQEKKKKEKKSILPVLSTMVEMAVKGWPLCVSLCLIATLHDDVSHFVNHRPRLFQLLTVTFGSTSIFTNVKDTLLSILLCTWNVYELVVACWVVPVLVHNTHEVFQSRASTLEPTQFTLGLYFHTCEHKPNSITPH